MSAKNFSFEVFMVVWTRSRYSGSSSFSSLITETSIFRICREGRCRIGESYYSDRYVFVVRFDNSLSVEETVWCLRKRDMHAYFYYFYLPMLFIIIVGLILELLVRLGFPFSIALYIFSLYLLFCVFSFVYVFSLYKKYYLVRLRIAGERNVVFSFVRDLSRKVKRRNFYPPRKIAEKVRRIFGVDLSAEYIKFLSLLGEAKGN